MGGNYALWTPLIKENECIKGYFNSNDVHGHMYKEVIVYHKFLLSRNKMAIENLKVEVDVQIIILSFIYLFIYF